MSHITTTCSQRVLRLASVLFLICGLTLLGPVTNGAGAIGIRVAPDGAMGGACGQAWSNPCDLQYALSLAEQGGDEIWVAAGEYFPTGGTDRTAAFQLKNEVTLYGGFAGHETAREQRDPGRNASILSGDLGKRGELSDNSYHVVAANGVDESAILDGFTITQGYANGAGPLASGAGMYLLHSSPTLHNLVFAENVAAAQDPAAFDWGGAGLANFSGDPKLTLVSFSDNRVDGPLGGGGGMLSLDGGYASLTNVTFSGNHVDYGGGGFYNAKSSRANLTNVTFYDNTAIEFGGGVFNERSADLTLTHVTFLNNVSNNGRSIRNSNSSSILLQNSIVWGPYGGQLDNRFKSILTVRDSLVRDGYADGDNILTADPLLGDFGDYSGGLQTIPLLPGSPAIDAAGYADCPAGDARDVRRPQGANCDLGAFESRGFNYTKSGDNQSAPLNAAFASPLTIHISSAYGEPIEGGQLTFRGPLVGPSTSPAETAAPILSGVVSVTLSANNLVGPYLVSAPLGYAPVLFSLSNLKGDPLPAILSHSPTSSQAGQPVKVTFKVTAAGGTPAGEVVVSDGVSQCQAPASRGGCTLVLRQAGERTLTAAYTGDESFNSAISAGVKHTVARANTTSELTASANPASSGQVLSLNAGVAGVFPSGTVTFQDNGDPVSGCLDLELVEGGATCNLVASTAGAHNLSAQYSGDANNRPSNASLSLIVARANPTIAITGRDPENSRVGDAVLVSFRVIGPGSPPSGEVVVSDGVSECRAPAARGECSLTLMKAGERALTAAYGGDDRFNPAISSSVPHAVGKANTIIRLKATADPASPEQALNLSARVEGATPTGAISFQDSGAAIVGCTNLKLVNGSVSCSLASPAAGSHSLSARYSGDANNRANRETILFTVGKAEATIAINGCNPESSRVGQPIAVTYDLYTGGNSPGGEVVISDGVSQCRTLAESGSCTLTLMQAGERSLTASFSGDARYNPAASSPVSHLVEKAVVTIDLAASDNPSRPGQTVNLSARVNGVSPSGTVTFDEGGLALEGCSDLRLTAGSAACSLAVPTIGAHNLTAHYSGDASNQPASANLDHMVSKASTAIDIAGLSAESVWVGETVTVTFHLTITTPAPGAGAPGGIVTVSDGISRCSAPPSRGSCSLTLTTAGAHTLTVTYEGDDHYFGSTSNGAVLNVTKPTTRSARHDPLAAVLVGPGRRALTCKPAGRPCPHPWS